MQSRGTARSSLTLLLWLGVAGCADDSTRREAGSAGLAGASHMSGGASSAGSAGASAEQGGNASGTGGTMGGTSSVAGMASAGASSTAGAGGAGVNTAGAASQASDLPIPPGGADVPRPTGQAGDLVVLDWAGFRAAVSYTFDDTSSSQVASFDALDALGVRYTFYLITGRSELASPVWKRAVMAGHELGNHTESHAENDDGTDTDAATRTLEQTFGIKVWTMAAPYGSATYVDIARTRFLINRGVANALIAPSDDSDPYNLPCYIPPSNASTAAMDAQVTSAQSEGKWRVVLVHGFNGGNDGAYQPVALEAFTDSVEHSKQLGDVWIDSVVNVGAYWRAQKLLAGATPTIRDGKNTWTWQLPAHFPPGKSVRVRVAGGTLEQSGKPLIWDGHGYYEVALDAGSLTLSP